MKYLILILYFFIRINIANPEAMSCIVLNLQKVSEPDAGLVQNVIDSISKHNEHFVTAVLRYWSIKTDIKELTKNITSLFDSPPASPQMKRKGYVYMLNINLVFYHSPLFANIYYIKK